MRPSSHRGPCQTPASLRKSRSVPFERGHVVLELEDQGIERGRMKHRKTEDLAEVRVELLEKQRSGDKLMYRH